MAKVKSSTEGGGGGEKPFTAQHIVQSDASGVAHSQMLDAINKILVTGQKPVPADYYLANRIGPHAAQLMIDAYAWRTANPNYGKRPEDKIQAFFQRPIDTNNPVDAYRASLRTINNSPVASYYDSPNVDLQKLQGVKMPAADALRQSLTTTANPYSKIMSDK